jgi:hypothetical protein
VVSHLRYRLFKDIGEMLWPLRILCALHVAKNPSSQWMCQRADWIGISVGLSFRCQFGPRFHAIADKDQGNYSARISFCYKGGTPETPGHLRESASGSDSGVRRRGSLTVFR